MIPSFDVFPGGCLITTASHQVHYAHAYMHTDLGFDMDRLLGARLDSILTPASRIFFDTYLYPILLNDGQCREAEITLISDQGRRNHVVVSARFLPGPERMVIWCILSAENQSKVYEDLRNTRELLRIKVDELRLLSATDALTGLPNRREFERVASQHLQSAARQQQPFAVLMFDIDHFKSINDTFGHTAGDEVLRAFGLALKSVARGNVIIARYGGEEFICALQNADAAGAMSAASRVHAAASSIQVIGRPVTVSIGVSVRDPQGGQDLAALIHQADLALYKAKSLGRNRTQAYGAPQG